MTTLTIFGATRGTGKLTLDRALAAGHHVRVLVRDARRIAPAPRLTIIEGDATDEAAASRAIAGADAVICAIGAPPRDRSGVRTRATAAIVKAMQAQGVARIVAVSTYGVAETYPRLPLHYRWLIFPLFLRHVRADHEGQERILRDSGLRWTSVRAAALIDDDTETAVCHGFDDVSDKSLTISRAAVADFVLQVIARRTYVRQAPALSHPKRRWFKKPAAASEDAMVALARTPAPAGARGRRGGAAR